MDNLRIEDGYLIVTKTIVECLEETRPFLPGEDDTSGKYKQFINTTKYKVNIKTWLLEKVEDN